VSNYVLLTGCTGLLGQYLLHDLLRAGRRVAVLVRPSRKTSAVERVEAILQRWESRFGSKLPRPILLEGDITREGFGLSNEQLSWVSGNCNSLIHNAAVLTFHETPEGEPFNTNVGGTRNVLATCRTTGIGDLHYISTAYVCGLREGTVQENELEGSQSFRNDYEKSKYEAELLVRSASDLDCVTVYRPTVIAGDSQTGYTCTYHGLYMYLRLISVLNENVTPGPDGTRHTPVKLGMTGDEKRNIIPVDWASQAISRLIGLPEAHGGTYHIAPENPMTSGDVVRAAYSYFNSYGVEFCGANTETCASDNNVNQAYQENMTMYQSYDSTDPLFDVTNLKKFLPDLPCPEIDEAMLHLFWRFSEEDRWGKRRPPKPSPFSADPYLTNLSTENVLA